MPTCARMGAEFQGGENLGEEWVLYVHPPELHLTCSKMLSYGRERTPLTQTSSCCNGFL